jgi:hypothetical protein
MAYVPTYVDDEEDQKKETQLALSEPTAPTASGAETGTASTSSPVAQKGYVGIGQYLQANREQAQDLAGRLTKPIEDKIGAAQSGQEQYNKDYQQNYNNQVQTWQTKQNTAQAAANKDWQNRLNEAYYMWQRTPSNLPPSNAGSVYGTGTSTANSLRDEREAAYRDLLANAPKANVGIAPSAPSYTPDTSGAQAAAGELEALSTPEGRQASLQGLAGSGYSPGENQFDAALLGMTDVGKTGEKYSGILNALRSPVAPTLTEPTGLKTVSAIPSSIADTQAQKAFQARNLAETLDYQKRQKGK